MKKIYSIFLMILLILVGCSSKNIIDETKKEEIKNISTETIKENIDKIDENKAYYTKDDVALYLHTYGKLPKNYLTKKEAQKLGWNSKEGNLWDVTEKGVIGGDVFGNREGKLPKDEKYFEADVNYEGGFRGADRLVYTKNGKVIYYTKDHYKKFEVLYE